ncbi:MFS transporter [Clostridium sp. NSJ-6]|uniref:MFS transporter n=1 Tax=Clostridium hominis TaxID=2763036 RepID=A0ABR7DDC4_9CLOT|nr:MFS transporter [Clostridium hominis]MBC5629400.1 MFS transporter [Clostridium hominis]
MFVEEKGKKLGYGSIIKEKNYLFYLLGQLISRFGDSIDTIAYGWMVYEVTGKTSLMALLFGINAIPTILFQPIAGVIISYKKKKNVLFICNLGRAVVVTITALMFLSGTLRTYHLFIFTFINSTFEAFQSPASVSTLPLILDKELFSYGMSLSSTLSRVVELVGLAIASGIIGLIGISGGMIINALSFYLCGVFMLLVKYRNEKLQKQPLELKGYFHDLKDGFNYMTKTKVILSICLFGAFFGVLLLPFNTLNIAFIGDELKLGPNAVGVANFTLTIGMILGSLIFPKLKEKFKGINVFVSCGILFGICYFSFPLLKISANISITYILLALLCILFGLTAGVLMTLINVAFMECIKEEFLGRVAGVFNALVMAATPIGSLLVASLCIFLNTSTLFLIFGIGTIILFILQRFNKGLSDI